MKVLFVSPAIPWPPDSGGRIRTYNLIRALEDAAEIHLRYVLDPGLESAPPEALRACCASVKAFTRSRPSLAQRLTRPKLERWFHSADLMRSLAEELFAERWDLVHLDEMFLARVLPPGLSMQVAVHHHKLDTQLAERLPLAGGLRGLFDRFKLHRLERLAAQRYRAHILCSPEDARALVLRHRNLEVAAIPSGFDPEVFRPREPAPARDANQLLYLGSMSYGPNVDAALHLVREIFPILRAQRPELRLDIVGREPTAEVRALAAPGVTVSGTVADVRPWLERAGALVAPLRVGGGTRLKLVEALAMHCPVVTSTPGAEGLALADGEHLRIADDPAAFAARTLEVLAAPEEAARMTARGAALVRARYSWSQLAEKLLAEWRRIASVPRGIADGRPEAGPDPGFTSNAVSPTIRFALPGEMPGAAPHESGSSGCRALLPRERRRAVQDRRGADRTETRDECALAVIAPHAGYVYSGAIAAEVYRRTRVPETTVLLGPNHTGLGRAEAIQCRGTWRVPGHEVPIDTGLAEGLRDRAGLREDAGAHLHEHSLEVHLPFLLHRNPTVSLVPICLAALDFERCTRIGEALAEEIAGAEGEVLIVASTDMSHQISAARAAQQDRLALDRIEALDAQGLCETVREHRISMCGVVPTAVALVAATKLGATRARVVRYGHSGETSGECDRVVGYAGVCID